MGYSWQEADAVLSRALELEDGARPKFLDEHCGTATPLRALIDRLLAASSSEIITPGGGASGPLWGALGSSLRSRAGVLPRGTRVGAYRIVASLGRGGMATVYRAERADGQFEHSVALKVLEGARDNDELTTRFAQERQILAKLDHSNIARLLDGGITDDGRPYVSMELVEGEPIDVFCDRLELTIEQRVALFMQVAAAVHYAHTHLVVHRDIKPSNILVTAAGQPKLLDFGIAKLLDSSAPHAAPETRHAHPMTPEYASPEQVRGEPLGTAADVYQLGYLLYELLTGRRPYVFAHGNLAATIETICTAEPTPPASVLHRASEDFADTAEEIARRRRATPRRLRQALGGDLGLIVLTALDKDPARRYASALELHADLKRCLDGAAIVARPPTLAYRTRKFVRRYRIGVAAAGLVVAVLAAGLAATAWQAARAEAEARRAAEVARFLVGLFEGAAPDAALGESVTAKALLDRGASDLEHRLAAEPAVRAEMQHVVGRIYAELGLYAAARQHLEAALGARRTLDAGSSATAETAAALAQVLADQGEYEAAEPLAREAVALARHHAGDAPAVLAANLAALGSLRSTRGDPEEGEALYLEALSLDRTAGDDRALAEHTTGLGDVFWRATRYDDAQRAHETALRLQQGLYGPEHTRIATTLLNLATALTERGEFVAAEKRAREALAMRRKLLGDDHPDVATALEQLGSILQRAGRLDAAEDVHRQALALRTRIFGPEHPSIGASLNHLGTVLYFKGKYREAAQMFERVLPIWTATLGPGHDDVLTVMNNAGAAWREAGEYAKAEPLLRETLARRREAFGGVHRYVAQSYSNLALVLSYEGKDAEAESAFRSSVDLWRRTMGPSHPDVGDGLAGLGHFLLERGRFAEAEPVQREALAIRAGALDAQAPLLASSRLDLGETLLRLGEPEEAEPLVAASLPVIVARWGEEYPLTVRAKRVYADIVAQGAAHASR